MSTETIWNFSLPPDKPNPFGVLGLPADATNEDVVERGKELCESTDREGALLYRWAMEQLITHPLTRFAWEWMEVPGAEYEDADWERFARQHKRLPIDDKALARESPPPQLADFRLDRLLAMFLDDELLVPAASVEPAVESCPFTPDCGPPPVEIHHVIFG
jgi:hypothetical protein